MGGRRFHHSLAQLLRHCARHKPARTPPSGLERAVKRPIFTICTTDSGIPTQKGRKERKGGEGGGGGGGGADTCVANVSLSTHGGGGERERGGERGEGDGGEREEEGEGVQLTRWNPPRTLRHCWVNDQSLRFRF